MDIKGWKGDVECGANSQNTKMKFTEKNLGYSEGGYVEGWCDRGSCSK